MTQKYAFIFAIFFGYHTVFSMADTDKARTLHNLAMQGAFVCKGVEEGFAKGPGAEIAKTKLGFNICNTGGASVKGYENYDEQDVYLKDANGNDWEITARREPSKPNVLLPMRLDRNDQIEGAAWRVKPLRGDALAWGCAKRVIPDLASRNLFIKSWQHVTFFGTQTHPYAIKKIDHEKKRHFTSMGKFISLVTAGLVGLKLWAQYNQSK